jgi:hypothetical protein
MALLRNAICSKNMGLLCKKGSIPELTGIVTGCLFCPFPAGEIFQNMSAMTELQQAVLLG